MAFIRIGPEDFDPAAGNRGVAGRGGGMPRHRHLLWHRPARAGQADRGDDA